jgi:hypothetical protein
LNFSSRSWLGHVADEAMLAAAGRQVPEGRYRWPKLRR